MSDTKQRLNSSKTKAKPNVQKARLREEMHARMALDKLVGLRMLDELHAVYLRLFACSLKTFML